jgi:hypothetical protein
MAQIMKRNIRAISGSLWFHSRFTADDADRTRITQMIKRNIRAICAYPRNLRFFAVPSTNRKYKDTFGIKAKMLSPAEAFEKTGFMVGGVCPFALPPGVKVYLDESLRRFSTVFPVCGSANSSIELSCDELAAYSATEKWVDVCV